MEFISHGKSGCQIEILNDKFNFILRKTSKSLEENSRHTQRIKKQRDFYQKNRVASVKTPEVFSLFEGSKSELSYADMKYIMGKDSLSFLKQASHNQIEAFINQLFDYLDVNFENSFDKIGYFENDNYRNKILKKVKQIDETLDFPRKQIIMDKLKHLPIDLFFIGECHGDLTLANMIHANGNLYVFDFLDMYVDSPIFDLISLRQDTHHLWSCFIYNDYNCRTIELLKYIDEQLKNKYCRIINNSWYNYLSLMNYVRMYRMYDNTKPHRELNFIYNCINEYL